MQVHWKEVGEVIGIGGALFYGVMKFFDAVGDRLNDDTKLEIAVWLVGVKVGQKVEPWPGTFARVFDRVFGGENVSWRFVFRASLAAVATMLLPLGVTIAVSTRLFIWPFLSTLALYIAYSDLSMLKSRFVLQRIAKTNNLWMVLSLLFLDMAVTFTTFVAVCLFDPRPIAGGMNIFQHYVVTVLLALIPALFADLWLWLYAGSGFVLKAARRFDLGFDWFNRKFDIEKKPLQSIGLVAGALVAVVYWTVVIVSRVLG